MHGSNPGKSSTSQWRVVLDLAAGKAVDTTRRSSIHRRWSPIRQQDHWLTATAGLVPHAQQQQRSGRVEMEETGSAPSQTTLLWLNGRSHVDPITTKQAHIRLGADPAALLTWVSLIHWSLIQRPTASIDGYMIFQSFDREQICNFLMKKNLWLIVLLGLKYN